MTLFLFSLAGNCDTAIQALVYLAKDQSSKAWWDDADDEANEMEEDTDTDGDLGTSEGHQVMRANIASGEDSNDPHQSTGQVSILLPSTSSIQICLCFGLSVPEAQTLV